MSNLSDALWTQGVLAYFASADGSDLGLVLESFEASLAESADESWDSLVARRAFFCASLTSDRAAAVRLWWRAVRSDPTWWPAHVELGVALSEAEDMAAAREAACAAIVEAELWTNPWQRPAAFLPGLQAKPFWDSRQFPWVRELERATDVIRAELESLLPAGSSAQRRARDQHWAPVGGSHRASGLRDGDAVSAGDWREVVLFGYAEQGGEPAGVEGRALAPRTASLVERLLPDAVEMAAAGNGEIIFSALFPGTHVRPHCARSNHRLTAHLGLRVPEATAPSTSDDTDRQCGNAPPGCGIRVGQESRQWRDGEVLVFDDSFEHEVWNDSGSVRVVLLIRFWHPSLETAAEREKALQRISDDMATLERLRLLPPLEPDFAEPGPELEELLRGASQGACPKCGEPDEGGDLGFDDEGRRVVMVMRCCGHYVL